MAFLTSAHDVNVVCTRLVDFYMMNNEEGTAREYGEWLVNNMHYFWKGKIVDALLGQLAMPHFLREPRDCVRALRVLHEVTTHCTEVDLKRLAMTTGILQLLKNILETPKVRGVIIRSTLSLMSNLLLAGWRVRDAFEDTGLMDAMLLLVHHYYAHDQMFKSVVGQVIWLLYHFLKYKVPGPRKSSLVRIGKLVGKLLSPNQDVSVLVPLLKLARLISEYHTAMFAVMIRGHLLKHVAPFLLSPVLELKRQAIFVLANTCQQHNKRQKHSLYRFPKTIIHYIHGMFQVGPPEIRVLAHMLLGGIIDNRCIRPEHMIGLIPKIVWCASAQEKELEVRKAASWTLVSMAMHLEPRNWPVLIESGGFHVLCQMVRQEDVPVQLLRNVLCIFLRITEAYRILKPFLMNLLWKWDVWSALDQYQESENSAVRTLSYLLCLHRTRDVCWVHILA